MILLERVKYLLRKNRLYKKYFQTIINDGRYFIRNCKYYTKYSFKRDKAISGNTVYFIIDSQIQHPGLVDRFKAIVGLYYIAKLNDFDFKIIFDHPFSLNNYLDVNTCNWFANREELSFSLRNVRLMAYNGSGKIPRLCKKVKQYHVYCYIGYDILVSNQVADATMLWRKLYLELFKPSCALQECLNVYLSRYSGYIAVHLRFVNALENFEGDHFNSLTLEKQENLINRCLSGIKQIINENRGRDILVFSDSNVFLKRVRSLPVVVLEGEIGHISFVDHNDNVVMKTFIDFYMLSKAHQVIIISAPEMYTTVFSYYAAIVGGAKAKELNV